MCTPWLCGRGFGEGGFLLEVPTTDLTVEEMGNAVESVVLICVPSGSSCSVVGGSSSVIFCGYWQNWDGYVLFLECDYTYIKVLKLLKNVRRFVLGDGYPLTSGQLVQTLTAFYCIVILPQGKSLKQREPK